MRSQRSPLAPSIYGQLAGALYGADAIPARWRAQLVMRDRIEELADELFAPADRVASAGPSPSLDTPASPPAQPAPPGDSYWVLDGQLLAGPYPGAEEGRGRRQARRVLDAGVTCFVDLTEEGEGPPLHPHSTLLRQIARKRKTRVTHLRLPIRDNAIPTSWQMRASSARSGSRSPKARGCTERGASSAGLLPPYPAAVDVRRRDAYGTRTRSRFIRERLPARSRARTST